MQFDLLMCFLAIIYQAVTIIVACELELITPVVSLSLVPRNEVSGLKSMDFFKDQIQANCLPAAQTIHSCH